jgi:hypothetical protein
MRNVIRFGSMKAVMTRLAALVSTGAEKCASFRNRKVHHAKVPEQACPTKHVCDAGLKPKEPKDVCLCTNR